MSKPRGKAPQIVRGKAPWKTLDAESKKNKYKPIKDEPQQLIDLCVNCEKPKCRGNCFEYETLHYELCGKGPITKTRYAEIPDSARVDLENGMRADEMIAKYNISEHTVTAWRKHFGIKKRNRKKEIDEEKFVELANAGMQLYKISKHFRIGTDRAKSLYEKYNIPIPPKNNIKRTTSP